MRISVLILCLISGVSLPAQELQYFNRAGQSCGKAEAEYYRISDINHSSGLIDVQEYFMDGQLRMEGSFITLQPELKHGAFTYYHRNGIVHRETNYREGKLIGKWAAFSENRELREVRLYDTTTTYPGYKLIYASSPHGEVQVDHGEGFFKKYNEDDGISEMGRIKAGLKTGVWKGFRKNGSLGYEEIYEKGVLKNGTLILENGDTIEYSAVFQAPKPIGGLERFNKYINRKIIYPTEAKMRGITGVVLVAFTVDETGAIKDPAIVKGIGFGCDEEALRVIRKANPWRPAYLRGIPVKQKVIQRVRFSLK